MCPLVARNNSHFPNNSTALNGVILCRFLSNAQSFYFHSKVDHLVTEWSWRMHCRSCDRQAIHSTSHELLANAPLVTGVRCINSLNLMNWTFKEMHKLPFLFPSFNCHFDLDICVWRTTLTRFVVNYHYLITFAAKREIFRGPLWVLSIVKLIMNYFCEATPDQHTENCHPFS